MTDRIGQQFGNYRLTRLLGEGGFAEVYLGEHLHLEALVAVKVLHTKFITREQEEFLREARTIASLEHPSIVRVLDCGIEAERKEPFIIMHYAANGTVRQRYPKGTRLSLTEIVAYIKQVASALQYAHDSKFVHRDVKPENMLLGAKDELLLSDFGIALISSSSSSQSTKAAAGTVAYMAPEQIMGKPRLASDQYALGIVIYEWLSGATPFHGSFSEMCAQHLYASPPSLREQVPSLDPGVEQVVLKALAKEPQERFASILDFAAALEQSLQPQPLSLPTIEAASTPNDALISTIAAANITDESISDSFPGTVAAESTTDEPISDPLLSTIASEVAIEASMLPKPRMPITPLPITFTQITATENASPPASIAPLKATFMQPAAMAASAPPTQPPENAPLAARYRRGGSGLASIATLIIAALLIISTFSYLTISHALVGKNQSSVLAPLSTSASDSTQASTQISSQQPTIPLTPQPTNAPTSQPTVAPTSPPATVPASQPVQRQLSSTQTASQTVNATGQGETQGTHATGSVRITSHDTSILTFDTGSIFQSSVNNPIQVRLDTSVIVPGCVNGTCYTADVNITVVQVGTVGNLAPRQFRYYANNFDVANYLSAFSGGTDPQSYTSVQQSDIDNTASPLISTTTSQAQTAIQNQLQPNEHLVGTPQCNSHTSANHTAGDKASTVTVTVTTTCTATASA